MEHWEPGVYSRGFKVSGREHPELGGKPGTHFQNTRSHTTDILEMTISLQLVLFVLG